MRRRSLLLLGTVLAALLPVTPSGASAIEDAVNAAPAPSLQITGPKGGADPPADGPGGIQVSWYTGTGAVARVSRSINGGKPEEIGAGHVGQKIADGAPPQARQVFKLNQSGLTPKHLVTAVLQNGKVTITETNRPVPPRDTPDWIDGLIRFAPFAILALFIVLTGLYLRSLRGLRNEQEPVDA